MLSAQIIGYYSDIDVLGAVFLLIVDDIPNIDCPGNTIRISPASSAPFFAYLLRKHKRWLEVVRRKSTAEWAFIRRAWGFSGLNLEIAQGEVLSILGPNGCGKPLCCVVSAGLSSLKRGTSSWWEDITKFDVINWPGTLDFFIRNTLLPSRFRCWRSSAGTHSLSRRFASLRHDRNLRGSSSKVGMLHLKDKPYTEISGGERQLILIARTLHRNRRLFCSTNQLRILILKTGTLSKNN